MTFNPNGIVITPNDWFWPNVVYEGRGRAEFEDPTGTIEGPVVVKFNEYGESSAQMIVETLASDRQLQFGSTEFLSGEKPVTEDGVVSLPLTFNSSPCKKLTVETAEGEFSSTRLSAMSRKKLIFTYFAQNSKVTIQRLLITGCFPLQTLFQIFASGI
jgi:hypothetical protein